MFNIISYEFTLFVYFHVNLIAQLFSLFFIGRSPFLLTHGNNTSFHSHSIRH